jgi:hypothetical protein
MKNPRTQKTYGLALAALLLGGTTCALASSDMNIHTFDSAAGNTGVEWGSSSLAWSGTEGNPAGALALTVTFGGSDTPMSDYVCLNGNPWWVGTAINFSEYKSIQFDIKWDNTSDVSVDQFNDPASWGQAMTNKDGSQVMQSWAGEGYMSGSFQGLEVTLCGGPGGQMAPSIGISNIPAAAANGWVHMTIPINQSAANLDGCSGVVFHKWINNSWGIGSNAVARFWIDNVMVEGTVPPLTPTLALPAKPVQGLNVFASTGGNNYWDRQSAVVKNNTGHGWLGVATPSNPVEYSFTIKDFPSDPATYGCEAWFFMIPNPPSWVAGAPDWNETNAIIAFIQLGAVDAIMHFQYKVNEPSQQAMYSGGNENGKYYTNAPGSWDSVTTPWYESGDIGSVTNAVTALGTWTIRFTSDTNVTLIAPDSSTSSFVIPPYNVQYLNQDNGMNLYLGMQANNAATMGKAVVYSDFAITGCAAPFSDNFLADTTLDTNAWLTAQAGGPAGVLVVPASEGLWISWSLPDTGFSMELASNLSDPFAWTSPTAAPIVPMNGLKARLVSTNDLNASAAFFRLVKRTFAKLQILLPGETAAPNTTTGKTGTPTAQTANVPFSVTVNAVDDTWHLVNATDTVSLTATDGANFMVLNDPTDLPLVNGTATFSVGFTATGSSTITATNISNGAITSATSATVTY